MRAILVVLLVLVLGAALYVWSGTYNIAAAEPHSTLVARLFAALRDRSIAEHSEDIRPPALTDPGLIQTGFRHYHSMCVLCHGAPGLERSEIGKGLNPVPPELDAEEVQARSDAELYWIVQNGIKMTGMPAFGETHGEKELWAIVAFLRRLPEIQPQEYSSMVKAAGLPEGAGGHSHAHPSVQGHGASGGSEAGTSQPHEHEHGNEGEGEAHHH